MRMSTTNIDSATCSHRYQYCSHSPVPSMPDALIPHSPLLPSHCARPVLGRTERTTANTSKTFRLLQPRMPSPYLRRTVGRATPRVCPPHQAVQGLATSHWVGTGREGGSSTGRACADTRRPRYASKAGASSGGFRAREATSSGAWRKRFCPAQRTEICHNPRRSGTSGSGRFVA